MMLLGAPFAGAEMCAIDAVPAATLLLPYFEVDLDNENGTDTLFTINNATPEPTLVHITFWTNLSQPTINFDLFLTGYDTQVVSLREVFDDGNLPITADEQSDPSDTISPHGTHPEWDGSFEAPPDCGNFFPFYVNPLVTGQLADRVRNGHTGKPIASMSGNCLGADLGDNVARGYITIDNARRCALVFPSDPEYFGGFDPVAIDDNRLWGDFMIHNPSLGYEARDVLVHLEADPSFDGGATSSGYTFYGRYSGGADHREPLANQWGVRYVNGGEGETGTDLLVWRDSTSTETRSNDGFQCGTGPDWLPLGQTSVLCFDEEENDIEVCGEGGEACFPYETQRTAIGASPLDVPYLSGWCRLDLDSNDFFAGDVDFPIPGSPLGQSYVTALTSNSTLGLAGAARAVAFGSSCTAPTAFSDILFADGFESGDATGWSTSSP